MQKPQRECALDKEELLLPANPGRNLFSPEEWSHLASTLNLTERELTVANLILEGKCRAEIARSLDISPETVRVYMNRLFRKLQVPDKVGLALRLARIHRLLASQPETNLDQDIPLS